LRSNLDRLVIEDVVKYTSQSRIYLRVIHFQREVPSLGDDVATAVGRTLARDL
jgi:hypothetical protein